MPSLNTRFIVAAALLGAMFSAPDALAETSSKVDLEQAKAELAKARQEAVAEKEEPLADKKLEEETPRKRLFGRGGKKEEKAKKESDPKPELKISEKEDDETSKPRARLFKRDKKVEAKPEKKEEQQIEPAANDDKKRGSVLKRLSPFNRDGKEEKSTEEKPAEKPKVAKVKSDGDEGERKKLLGGLFGKDSSAPTKEEPEKPEAVVAKKDEKKKDEDGGFKGFGLFRNKSDSKEFAKVDKTKLGKTVDTKPAKLSKRTGGVLSKKSADTGELGWYVVTETKTPFYAVGPGQPMPPEKILDRGSMLTVTKGGWGWCNVKLGGGELGVVSAKSMRPATLAEVSRHTRPVATASRSRGSRSLFNILGRGPAPVLDLPTNSGEGPIRNFGLLPPVDSSE